MGQSAWVEPMTKWLGKAVSICSIAQTDDFSAKKQFLREIFGLNLFFNKQKCRRKRRPISNPLKNPWFALRATKEKTARLGDNFIEKSELEPRSGLEPETSSLPWMRSTN